MPRYQFGFAEQRHIRPILDQPLLEGVLALPPRAHGLVVFVHDSGVSRYSPHHRYMARQLQQVGIGTLLIDLLRIEEALTLRMVSHQRMPETLGARLLQTTDWLATQADTAGLPLGYFGVRLGASAAVQAATSRPGVVHGVAVQHCPAISHAIFEAAAVPLLFVLGTNESLPRELLSKKSAQTAVEQLSPKPDQADIPDRLDEFASIVSSWFTALLHS